ncbi:MAG: hypothetical protein KF784_11565 [Fimbriimonadaceae bacterium]|nr:hypothetical protein [Fimbriimonadaceae bacterium]
MADRFELGNTYITPNAECQLEWIEVLRALNRHALCDWGEVDDDDRKANDRALQHGSRLLSVYRDGCGTKFWIITEADRSATTVLLPEDY